MHSLLELTQKIRTKSVLKFCRKVHKRLSVFGALVVTLRTCYGALQIVVLLLLFKHTNTHSESDRQTDT